MSQDGRGRTDGASVVAGVVALVLALVLGLDRAGAVDLGWASLAPMLCAALGAVLLASGLGRPR